MKWKVECSGWREELPPGAPSGRVSASQGAAVERGAPPIRVGSAHRIEMIIDQGKKYDAARPAWAPTVQEGSELPVVSSALGESRSISDGNSIIYDWRLGTRRKIKELFHLLHLSKCPGNRNVSSFSVLEFLYYRAIAALL